MARAYPCTYCVPTTASLPTPLAQSVRVLEASEANGQLQVQLASYEAREAERALESKRALVRHIGHEIRTPLNIVGVGADVLSKELKALGNKIPPTLLELVEGIEDASAAALEVRVRHVTCVG